MKGGYDLIGDVHGHYDPLVRLLGRLGYGPTGSGGFHHPAGRQVIFLGDCIDRGPKVREVLRTVRAMVEAGDALAILGNHEHVAICYHEPDGAGGWLRPPWLRHGAGLAKTISEFDGREEEWAGWLEWLKTLPLYLDLGPIRAVHACWDPAAVAWLGDRRLADQQLLRGSVELETMDHWAVQRVLNGPEMSLPEGALIVNALGLSVPYVRVRWWDIPAGPVDLADLALPKPLGGQSVADLDEVGKLPNYPSDAPPVFFGHYWLAPSQAKAPLRGNVACLDYSVARNGPLVAYRWQGESVLVAEHFVW